MNKAGKLLVIIVVSALLTSCIAEWGTIFTQECPSWSNTQGECEVQRGFVEQEYTVRLDNWDQVRLQVQGRMVVNDPVNVIFYAEDGKTTVDPTTMIFTAGTYYVHRVEEGTATYFVVTIAEKSDRGEKKGTFSLVMDLVRSVP